jgi:hypothetical protein
MEQLSGDHRMGPKEDQGIATAVIDQVLRDVYAALVLGCKMEMPGNSLMARGIS